MVPTGRTGRGRQPRHTCCRESFSTFSRRRLAILRNINEDGMNSDRVVAQVRELSGMEIQAVTLVRNGPREATLPRVWAVMTEHGQFWAAEDGAALEMFRAVNRPAPSSPLTCQSAVEAARRFLALHPRSAPAMADEERPAETETTESATTTAASTCDVCGESFVRRTRRAQTRSLCSRCRHAEHERLRYQQDPRYRARRLAYSASRYRDRQQSGDADQ
jgi:hypothetical protein